MSARPSFRNLTLDILDSLFRGDSSETDAWSEALLRYCEVNSGKVASVAQKKWPDSSDSRNALDMIFELFLRTYRRTDDKRYLNIALKLVDRGVAQPTEASKVNDALATLRQATNHPLPPVSAPLPRCTAIPKIEGGARVVILSPSPFSLFTITVTELLRRSGVEICAIVVRRLLDPKRFTSESRRDGKRLQQKIWRKLILRSHAYHNEPFETVVDFMNINSIAERNLSHFQKAHGIRIISCRDFSKTAVLQAMEDLRPDLTVFTGGGIVGLPVLDRSRLGVVNCHMGVLPYFRGMDVVEWPILLGEPDKVGLTVHVMDTGIDTGDILSVSPIAPQPGESISSLRQRFEPFMCREIVRASLGLLSGTLRREPQKLSDGKQYFIMHRELLKIAEARAQRTP